MWLPEGQVMDLILWRHAEAEDGVPDAARKLTRTGLKQAKSMAEWLKSELPEDVRVIVSPTKRTQQTATAFASDFETNEEIAPGASAHTVLAVTDWPNAQGTVLLVGHQPTLGETAGLLIPNIPAGLSFKKGAVWWFSCEVKQDIVKPVLRTVMYPDML